MGSRVGVERRKRGFFVGEGVGWEGRFIRCLVFCKLFFRILRIFFFLFLDSVGRMRLVGRDLGWIFLG